VTVVLVGEGSDEVFGGYDDMNRLVQSHETRWRRLRALPRPFRLAAYELGRAGRLPLGRLDVIRRAALDHPFYLGLDVVFSDLEKRQLIRKSADPLFSTSTSSVVQRYCDELAARRPEADFLQQMSYIELSNRLPELLLMRVDKFSMAHSLEARAPFLDHELVSYVLSLPQRSKIDGRTTKKVLKQALSGIVPSNVISRRKQGFRVPLPAWLAGPLAGWAEERLFSKAARQLDFFDFDYIRTLWQRHRSGIEDQSFDLWCLINFFGWYERWLA
jgi:asparagine synthase (glutamine-hydrolysing)